MAITVYGASDDIIEVDGDISAEFPYRNAEPATLGFSDGTLLRITYTNAGIWRISPIVRGAADLTIEQAPENDDSNYSDRATLSGAVWVVHGIDHATR
ncbi:hypothetical protein [Micromonospora sp. NBC_00421]|uniref:hypothetical protein n=1 Tax=Micromonospora sp. NBC_00421 TaxID=2975976 RepID=UPI002E22FDBF